MIDNIVGLVKDQVLGSLTSGNIDIPSDKKDQIIDTTTNSLVDGLKSSFSLKNIPALTKLFKGQSSASVSNGITDKLESSVISSLTEKVGISKDLSNSIASTVIPAVVSMFQEKINDPSDSSFSIESLIKSFSGNSGGGILGMLKGLFGK